MALSYSIVKKSVAGNTRRHLVDVTVGVAGDYSSGLTLDAASCGLTRIDGVSPYGADVAAIFVWDPTTSKLRAYKTGAALSGVLAEAAGADVATKKVRVEAVQYSNG